METNNKYTPATVNHKFSIPLYQRLFEWEKEEVEQLLSDLYSSFKKQPDDCYYIGVLTVYYDKRIRRYSLVDGQQRFTVLMLMGIVLNWRDFLESDNELRLGFFARRKDQEYLQAKIEQRNYHHPNQKMEEALKVIADFLENLENADNFKSFAFEKTTFFLSELPDNYSTQELNQYFEAMNEAGKGLENHEILKVRILKEISDDKKEECTKIWNLVSEVDKCIILQKNDDDDFQGKVKTAFDSLPDDILKELESKSDNSEKKPIKEIAASSKKPQAIENDRSEKSILSFTDFLIQVLWLTIDNENIPVTDFFNRHKLLETFHKYLFKNEDTKQSIPAFFNNLLRYRLLFDYFIIRINSADGKTNNYSLNFYQENDNNDDQHHEHKQQLIQYQSMLYVSTSYYLWLSFILKALNKKHEITYKELIDTLKNWDNERHKDARFALEYGSIDRYWFWRLDYYLWENRSVQFKITDIKKVADSYIFKTNRSIEHIAPQTPKSESNIKLGDDLLHQFGNLAMISAGQNSSLKNESYEVKRAHVQSFVKSVRGTIESLKLLMVHEYDTWNEENIKKHHNEMIDVLIDSFCPKETIIIEYLRKQKIEEDAQ